MRLFSLVQPSGIRSLTRSLLNLTDVVQPIEAILQSTDMELVVGAPALFCILKQVLIAQLGSYGNWRSVTLYALPKSGLPPTLAPIVTELVRHREEIVREAAIEAFTAHVGQIPDPALLKVYTYAYLLEQ